jgi:hypothetical protein
MQVDRHTKGFGAFPKRPESVIVVVPTGRGIADVGVAVEHRPVKAEPRGASLQLRSGGLGVLHRQRGEAAVAQPIGGHDFGKCVVDLLGFVDCLAGIGLCLYARRIQRQHRIIDARGVHVRQTLRADVQQPAFNFSQGLRVAVVARNLELGQVEVLFESNLAIHPTTLLGGRRTAIPIEDSISISVTFSPAGRQSGGLWDTIDPAGGMSPCSAIGHGRSQIARRRNAASTRFVPD